MRCSDLGWRALVCEPCGMRACWGLGRPRRSACLSERPWIVVGMTARSSAHVDPAGRITALAVGLARWAVGRTAQVSQLGELGPFGTP